MRTFILFIGVLFFPTASFAAEISFEQNPAFVRAGDMVVLNVFLDTTGNTVNAVEGSIRFSDELNLLDVRLTNSLVPLWVTPPAMKIKGTLSFAGVLPGGYEGQGNLFTLVFSTAKKGDAQVSVGDTAVYKNDGLGSRASIAPRQYTIVIHEPSGKPFRANVDADVLPPEPFVPELTSGEPFMMQGPVLVFSTIDKDSGVDHYELASSYMRDAKEKDLSWNSVESPYALTEEDGARYVYIRVIDRAGNTRLVVIPPQHFGPMVLLVNWWPLLILVGIGGILMVRFRVRFR